MARWKKQAGRIVLWIQRARIDVELLKQGIKKAKYWDKKKKIKEIIILNNEGKKLIL